MCLASFYPIQKPTKKSTTIRDKIQKPSTKAPCYPLAVKHVVMITSLEAKQTKKFQNALYKRDCEAFLLLGFMTRLHSRSYLSAGAHLE